MPLDPNAVFGYGEDFSTLWLVEHKKDGTHNLGGSLPSVAYRLVSDGVNVTAYDKNGSSVATGTDTAVVLAAVLPANASRGGTISFRNDGAVFPWATFALLPKGITGRLTIDFGDAVHTLTAGNYQYTDWNYAADYDTFQNITLRNGIFDATGATGSHCLIGGGHQRINFQDLEFRNLRFVNVPESPTAAITCINLSCSHLGAGETTTYIRRITCEGIYGFGGIGLITFTGGGVSVAGINIVMDEFYINDWRHEISTPATAFYASAHIQIGSRGKVGVGYVGHGYGKNSGDVGIEIDDPEYVLVDAVTIDDSWVQGFFYTSANNNYGAASEMECRDCTYRCINTPATNTQSRGFVAQPSTTPAMSLGTFRLKDCRVEKRVNSTVSRTGWALYVPTLAAVGVDTLIVDGLKCIEDSISLSSGNISSHAIWLSNSTGTLNVDMGRLVFTTSGDVTGATMVYRGIQFDGGNFSFRVRDVRFNVTLTGNASNVMWAINIGNSAVTAEGLLDGVTLATFTGGASSVGVQVRGTSVVTVPAKKMIQVRNSDLAAAATAINLAVDTAAQPAVYGSRNVYPTTNGQPAPTTLTGLVTATGKALGTVWDAVVQFVQGSGTAITAIDVSTNGGTTYTNLLTQASGALPAGFDQTIGPLRSDSLIKVTFTGTQPTINLYPANT